MWFSRIKTHGHKQILALNDENLCTPSFPWVGAGILPGWPPLPTTSSLSAGLFLQPVVLTLTDLPALFSLYFIFWYHWKPPNQLVTAFIFYVSVLVVKPIVCYEYSNLNLSKQVSWFLCLRPVDLTKVLLSLFCFSNNY